MADACPICERPGDCRGYPHLWRRLREDSPLWLPVHAIVNGLASPIDQARHDAARAAALTAEHPPGDSPVPLGRCCG